jgi:hypothetical protein
LVVNTTRIRNRLPYLAAFTAAAHSSATDRQWTPFARQEISITIVLQGCSQPHSPRCTGLILKKWS